MTPLVLFFYRVFRYSDETQGEPETDAGILMRRESTISMICPAMDGVARNRAVAPHAGRVRPASRRLLAWLLSRRDLRRQPVFQSQSGNIRVVRRVVRDHRQIVNKSDGTDHEIDGAHDHALA